MVILRKLFDIDILDIIPFNSGFIYAEKINMPDGKIKIAFMSYDIVTKTSQHVTKGAYLLNKFGPSYKPIANQLGNYVTCETGILYNKRSIVVFPSGEAGLFNSDGELLWTGDLIYHDCPVRSVIVDGKYFWCVVPQSNSVIRYNSFSMRVDLRIGGGKSAAFSGPESIFKAGNKLYVCNASSCKIRTINLMDYAVRDYLRFNEPVRKYLNINGNEIMVLDSGVYIL